MTKPRSKPIKQKSKESSTQPSNESSPQSSTQSSTQSSGETSNNNKNNDIDNISDEFIKVIYDLINDILFSFPEFKDKLHIDLYNIKDSKDENSIKNVYQHIKTVYPERFFDILYENKDMFTIPENNLEFLPGIDYRGLWRENITDSTKNTLWKYLQLILFSTVSLFSKLI